MDVPILVYSKSLSNCSNVGEQPFDVVLYGGKYYAGQVLYDGFNNFLAGNYDNLVIELTTPVEAVKFYQNFFNK